ncbi:MAG: hypothetical protein RL660_1205 [Bacteroidota bacterium]|jgi:uncharacterized lipoprotein YddW (UPF0748 family)
MILLQFMKFYTIVAACLCFMAQAIAAPKYEFRGAWIATIGGIDWPSPATKGNSYLVQQEYKNILDELSRDGINAVIVQIRPAADAFYPSTYEPWSKYLTGKQGIAPDPYYDALQFAIEEAHARGMEFHAWFNPYRALVDATKNPNPANHVTRLHPDWFVNYGGKKYFNPGLPQVRAYVSEVICEVVRKYDIDAVHFDDYFYPYRIAGKEFPDLQTFYMHGGSFLNKEDWRRDNVNVFVRDIQKAIRKIKTDVKLGISPFGVWRNASKDPEGSQTDGGQTNYDDLYADVLLWLKNGWIDYVLPQLYWEQSHKKVGFNVLLDWWANHSYGKAMYAGHGLYRVANDKAAAWHNPAELEQQVQSVRSNRKAQGSCFYSANYFFKNKLGCITSMRNYYSTIALVPPMRWIDSIAPKAPKVVRFRAANGVASVEAQHSSADGKYFVLYKFGLNERADLSKAEAIVKISHASSFTFNVTAGQRYLITSTDRLHNESAYTALE